MQHQDVVRLSLNITVLQKHGQSSVPAYHNSKITELFSLTANQTLQSGRPFSLKQLKNTQPQRGKCTAPPVLLLPTFNFIG